MSITEQVDFSDGQNERERERERDRRNLLVVGDESSNIIRKKEIESESKEGWGGSKFVEFEEKKTTANKDGGRQHTSTTSLSSASARRLMSPGLAERVFAY